jgi:hypothetical protein
VLLLLFSWVLFAQTLNVSKGWNLLGVGSSISMQQCAHACVESVFAYEAGAWKVYHSHHETTHPFMNLTTIKAKQGFWVNAKEDCAIELFEKELFSYDFEGLGEKQYANHEALKSDLNMTWVKAFGAGRVSIEVSDEGDHYLKVKYPQGTYGTTDGGLSMGKTLPSQNEVLFSFKVQFATPFSFGKGGKLFGGVTGGMGNTGGQKPNGSDGWSVRYMHLGNKLYQYVYHPDQAGIYGDELVLQYTGEDILVESGRWYQFKTRVKVNDAGKHNGVIQTWIDSKLVLDRHDFRFRDHDHNLTIEEFLFTSFLGGSNEEWAAQKDEYILYDDILFYGK